jgi:putative NADPH-quinone reductase
MLKIIGTFILIYLIFRVLTAYVFPWIVKWYLNRVKEKFYQQNPQYAESQKKKKKGDLTITYKDEMNQPDTDNLGEYTDFEDVKEE